MSYIDNNGKFNHGKWMRDRTLNEGPVNDPMLKSLRTRVKGEKFPNLKFWWEYEPSDIMTYVYWHQGQLPPTGKSFEKEYANIVKQLHVKYPIPSSALPKLDVDDRTERELSVDAPGRNENKITEGTKAYELGDMWSNDFDYIGMLKFGAQVTDIEPFADMMEVDEQLDTLNRLFDSFEDVNYHREKADLGNAIEWLEDDPRTEDIEKANEFLALFRKKCASTLDVMGVKWTPKG